MGAGYQSNGTFGRVQTMQCTKDDPTGEKQYAKALLADLQDQWQAHTSGEVPLSPSSSLALRGELDRLSKIVYGDVPMMSAGYSAAESAYLEEQSLRQGNTLGMWAWGPMAWGAAIGRLAGAPEAVVGRLGEISVNLTGAGAMGRGRAVGERAPSGPTVTQVVGGGRVAVAARVKWSERRAGHVFRQSDGHVNPATKAEQQAYIREFQDVASNPANARPDAVQAGLITQHAADAGASGFTQINANGTQTWVIVRGDTIINAGINPAGAIR